MVRLDVIVSGSSDEVVLVVAHKFIVLQCQVLLCKEQEQVSTVQLGPMVGNDLQEQTLASHDSQAEPGVHSAAADVMVLELDEVVSDVVMYDGVVV